VAVDGAGNVYVAEQRASKIRKITPAGIVTTLVATDAGGNAARFEAPWGVATDTSGNVYVADSGSNAIRKITPAGVGTTLAGSAGTRGSENGAGADARFAAPSGIACDGSGNVYVGDTGNHTIRRITPGGVVTTLAGSAGLEGQTDGAGKDARFKTPMGVAVDAGGNVYVADSDNFTIRKITPAGVVTTLAGAAGRSGFAEGAGSAALFFRPKGVATDSGGNVYVTEQGKQSIRKITPAGVVTTLAGAAENRSSEDGTGSAARFDNPAGIACDGAGNIYIADETNHKIRIGRLALADTAAIDSPTGALGEPRQLSTSSRTATSWQWTLIRQPAASAARLSSTSIANPRFTPDVPDLYIFQLTATDGKKTSITTVSLTATAPGKP
jgi:sugar lactone lactonase YvrE